MKNPCYGCEKRSITCHSECEAYLTFYAKSRETCEKKLQSTVVRDFCRTRSDRIAHIEHRKAKVKKGKRGE